MAQAGDIERLRRIRDELRDDLASIGDFRPGALVEITRKCGTAGCRCARPGDPGHRGWTLARTVRGRRVNRGIPRDALEQTRAQLAEHARLKDLSRRLVEASEDLCRARLAAGRDAGRGTPKGGSGVRLTVAFAADIAAEIDALAGAGAADGIDFEALETAVRRQALGLAARLVERRLNAGRRAKAVTTVLDALRLERAYYRCARRGTGFHPRDRALGIEGASLSSGVVRMTGLAAARASFAETGALLHGLAGVNVDAKQAERTAEALGREIAADERDTVAPEPGRAPTMYLGLDGTGVPVRRAELAGRAGKQADGSARTREVKLVAVWAGTTDAHGRELPGREPGSVSYSAAIESDATRDADAELSPFAGRVEREARRRGFDRAPRRVVLGDGALWIWNIADELFPRRRPDRRPVPRQAPVGRRQGGLRPRHRHGRALGQATLRRTRRRPSRHAAARAARPRGPRPGAPLHRLHPPQPPPHALPGVPRHGPVRGLRHRRGGLQERRRNPLQTSRHALVGRRRQRHGRPALLRPHQPLRRLPNPAQSALRRLASNKFVVHP